MEHDFLARLSALLAGPDIEVVRWLPYSKRVLDGKTQAAGQTTRAARPLAPGGEGFAHPRLFLAGSKSMGGRMAAELYQDGGDEMDAAGLIVLGYPFPPPPAQTAGGEVLKQITTPTCCCRGSAIPSAAARAGRLPLLIRRIGPLADRRDHGFKPRKASGLGDQDNLREAAERIRAFVTDRLAHA